MLSYLLLAVTIVSSILACAVARNNFSKRYVTHNGDLYAFNTLSALLSLLTLLVISALKRELCVPTFYTVWMGALYGAATALFTLLNMKALQNGPLSYTNTIVFCAMVIPSLSGMALYGEPVSAAQYAGVALMLFSFAFSVDRGGDTRGMNLRWLLLCIGAFVFNGAVGVMQKIHQNSPDKGELGMFLLVAFAVCAAMSAVLTLLYARKTGERVRAFDRPNRRGAVLYAVLTGVGIGVCNQINTYLAGVMPSILFFPLVNGVAILFTLLIGLVFWKERFSRRQWIGLTAGVASIALLCGLF